MPAREWADMEAKLPEWRGLSTMELARKLIESKLLTEFQARRLLTGRGRELVIGRYAILDRLGKGSMGEVFLAQHLLMGRLVALKRMPREVAENDKAVSRFHREMRLVGRLDHPNIVRAFDADARGKILYIVMEYVRGKSLMEVLKAIGPLPIDRALDYMVQAARGLDHAHEQGIVHRDVKPSNLLLTDEGQVKVLDLGLGVLMESDPNNVFQTSDGIAVGTLDYMSPEQALGKDVDGRSDIFNLGVTLYYLLSGRYPFAGQTPVERLGKRIIGQGIPIKEVRADVPDAVQKALSKLMATKPHDRPRTAREAADLLEKLRGELDDAATLDARTSRAGLGNGASIRGSGGDSAGAGEGAGASGRKSKSGAGADSWGEGGGGSGSGSGSGSKARGGKGGVRAPNYPGWFRGMANLAATSPGGALAAVLSLFAATLAAGVAAGYLLAR